VVRVSDDMAEVHTLQEDHGGWVDDMALVRPFTFPLCICTEELVRGALNFTLTGHAQ
jgi:hypothetical protein